MEGFTAVNFCISALGGPLKSLCYSAPITMGFLLFHLFSWWGLMLQAVAIVHFIRRRPDMFWLWIILIGGWLGALVYIVSEMAPDAGLLKQSFKVFPRRRRIRELEAAVIDNPSAGNYEELGDLYSKKASTARSPECFNRAISSWIDSPDPFTGLGPRPRHVSG